MRCVSRRLRELRRYNEDRARRYKVEKASEEIIMENGARRRGNKGVKQKRGGGGKGALQREKQEIKTKE